MDRVIEVQVKGGHLSCDSATAGVQGEANAAALRITFDAGWDGLAKTVTFWNARGENEVKRILTADLLENITASGRVYLAPIPGEAMTAAGKCRFAIDGYIAGQRQRSIYAQLVVRPAGNGGDSTVDVPTPTQAEQLQTQIDTLQEELQTKAVRAETAAAAARDSENAARASEEAADYEALLDYWKRVEPLIPDSAREYFGIYQLHQTEYMLLATRWLTDILEMLQAESAAAVAEKEEMCLGYVRQILSKRTVLEQGKWENWFRNDTKIGINNRIRNRTKEYAQIRLAQLQK
jgi:hypothetical protein